MTHSEHKLPAPVENERALLAAYSEVCKSYHAIDDFRMKLLGFLPLASIVAIAYHRYQQNPLGCASTPRQ